MSFSPTIPFRCSNLCAPRPTTLAPRLSFILNIHPAEFSTLFRYSVLPAIAMESQPDNNLIVPNLSVIFMYIDRFCRYCCRRSVYFCFPFSFFFFFQHSRYFRTFISLSLQLPFLFIRYRFLRCLCPNEIYSSGVTHATKWSALTHTLFARRWTFEYFVKGIHRMLPYVIPWQCFVV